MKVELYSRNFRGDVIYWSIEPSGICTALITHGLNNGKLITSTIEHPNIESEIQSRINKKRKEGYVAINITPGVNDIYSLVPTIKYDDNYNTKPMKCQPFKEKKLRYPVFGQPKLNGLRCVLRWEKREEGDGMFKQFVSRAVLRTKDGLEYVLSHITTGLDESHFKYEDLDLAFDGELYIHGKPLNYIKSSCPMTNSKGTLSKPSGNPLLVEFHIFDLAISNALQSKRLDVITYLNSFNLKSANKSIFSNGMIRLVESTVITSDYGAQIYRDNCIRSGFEGCVLRTIDAEYSFGHRPSFIMKFKDHMDSEFLILDIIPQDADPTLPKFVIQNDENNETFESVPIGTREDQREYLRHKESFIGKYATVRYRERTGAKGVPFHTNVIDIRTTNT